MHAVERGAVVNQYNLIAFGGGAPLHAARVAEKIGVKRVIVPPNAGVGSAVGFLAAPVSYELVRSRYMRLDAFDADAASELLKEMSAEATALVAPGARGMATFERRVAFMRYVGQGHEIVVELPPRPLQASDAQALREAFERDYAVLFERHIPNAAIEILSWSVQVSTEAKLPASRARRPPCRSPCRSASGRCSTAAAAAPPRFRSIAARRCRRQRLPGAGDRRRGRDLDLYFGQFCRAYRCLRLYRHGPQGRVRKA